MDSLSGSVNQYSKILQTQKFSSMRYTQRKWNNLLMNKHMHLSIYFNTAQNCQDTNSI